MEILHPVSLEETEYQKIGGWLALVGIGIVVDPFLLLHSLVRTQIPFLLSGNWAILVTPGTEVYHPMWALILLFELLGTIAFLVFSIILAIFFFQKHRLLPKMFIAFSLLSLAYGVISYLLMLSIPVLANQDNIEIIASIVRSVIFCLIWIPYFLISKRVKGTFVH